MGIRAELEGNLVKNPEGRRVVVDGEPRDIVEICVFSDVRRQVGDTWEQDDQRSGPVDVTIWGPGLGEVVLQHLRKGNRVLVTGQLHLHEYVDKDEGHHARLRMTADNVGLVPYRIESVRFAPSRREAEGAPA